MTRLPRCRNCHPGFSYRDEHGEVFCLLCSRPAVTLARRKAARLQREQEDYINARGRKPRSQGVKL